MISEDYIKPEPVDPSTYTSTPSPSTGLNLTPLNLVDTVTYSLSVENLSLEAPTDWKKFSIRRKKSTPEDKLDIDESNRVRSKLLIKNVNLNVESGQLTAIIGGSGSGKTTLLNCIAGRLGNLVLSSGSVTFTPLNSSSSIGFVRQEDSLLPYLTVRETLEFTASLKLPKSTSQKAKSKILDSILIELGLKEVEHVLVGGPFRKGCSGGEKRRLSIACILVSQPAVLILDEPTTGLDSFTAYQLLETLSRLAKKGRIVVLSIHQPRSDAFPIFDKVLLLSAGSPVFSGSTSELLPHFKSQGYEPKTNTNPLDFVIDVSSIDTRDEVAEEVSRKRVGELVLAWRKSELISSRGRGGDDSTLAPTLSLASTISATNGFNGEEMKGGGVVSQKDRPNHFAQTLLLTKRGLTNVRRNYGQNLGFFSQAAIIGVALGLAFLNPPETPSGIQSLKTIIYMSTPAFFYLGIIVYIYILTSELVIFDREREDHLYGTLPAVISCWLTYLPANVVFPTLYAIIVYFMTGFWRENLAVNLLSFIAQCIMQQLSAFGYALLCSSIDRSFATASLLGNGFSIPFILSSGYLIVNLPVWIAWTRWISPYFYGFHWIARLQFSGREFECAGITGPARNACSGTAVLVGLDFPLDTPVYVYPLGLLGFIIATSILSALLLQFYKPGGVQHAAQISSDLKNLQSDKVRMDEKKTRERVDVVVEGLGLIVSNQSILGLGNKTEKAILTNLDAYFPSGQVSCIMGPSGAGKSSLLQLLAGRLALGPSSTFSSTGNILFNGKDYDSSTMSSLVAFVEQEDQNHLPALTVRETLRYAASLRIRNQTSSQCDARAEEVMRMLGLKPCADNMVGGPLVKGISGGEKRRLSLAIQLLSDPSVLVLDEPLSGLDSFTAHNVMLTLKEIAATGRTVIVSVHQPRSDIWEVFDNILLLVKGGKTAYSGSRENILKFFEEAGSKCPEDFNPADFILDSISIDHRSIGVERKDELRIDRILSAWKDRSQTQNPSHNEKSKLMNSKQTNAPFFKAFLVVLSRSFKNMRRQQDVFVARLINPPFLALIFFLFFGRPSSAQTRVGLLQETTAIPFVGMLACIAIFPVEKSLFYYEYKSSARQSVSTFLLAYSVQEAVVSLVGSLLFSVVTVYGVGLQDSPRIFLEFWFCIFSLLSTGESIGIIFSAFSQNGGITISLVSAGLTLLSQLNGIISVSLPYWLEIVGWISPMKLTSRIQIINEMTGLVFDCDADSIASGACIASTGEQLLATFNIPEGGTGKYMGILFSLIVFYRLIAYAAIRIKVSML